MGGVNNELFNITQMQTTFPKGPLQAFTIAFIKCEDIFVQRAITANQQQLQQGGRGTQSQPHQTQTYFQNTRREVVQQPRLPPRPAPVQQQQPHSSQGQFVPLQCPNPPQQQDQSKIKCYKFHQFGHYARDCRVQVNELQQEDIQEILQMHYTKSTEPIPEEEEPANEIYSIPVETSTPTPAEGKTSLMESLYDSPFFMTNAYASSSHQEYPSIIYENTDQSFY